VPLNSPAALLAKVRQHALPMVIQPYSSPSHSKLLKMLCSLVAIHGQYSRGLLGHFTLDQVPLIEIPLIDLIGPL